MVTDCLKIVGRQTKQGNYAMLLKRFSVYECSRLGEDLQMWSVDKIQNRWFYHMNSLDVRYYAMVLPFFPYYTTYLIGNPLESEEHNNK